MFSSTVRTRLRTEDIKLRLSIIMTRKRNPIVKSLQQENDSIASFFFFFVNVYLHRLD